MTSPQTDPEVLAGVVLGALKSPSHPACSKILTNVADWLEGVVDQVEKKAVCSVWCNGDCPCSRPVDWPTCYYDGCGRAVLRRDYFWCQDHDREKDPLKGRRWICACGWWGLDHRLTAHSEGHKVCPDCGGSGGLELATPRTYGRDPSRGHKPASEGSSERSSPEVQD